MADSYLERSYRLRLASLGRQNFAAVNPNLYTDHAVRGTRFCESVFDVGAQRVQRQTSLQIPFGTSDFVSVQAPAHADLDSFASETQRRIHGLAHCAAETHAFFQLQRDRLRHQLRIEFRLVHFLNIDVHLAVRPLLHFQLQLVDLGAFAADDDARARGLDDDAQLVARTLDLDGAHARRLELVLQFGFQLDVFKQQLVVVPLDKPARFPRLRVSKPESVRMYFLTHVNQPLALSF